MMNNNNNNSNNNKRKKKRKYYGYCYSIIILSVWCIIFIIYFQSTPTTTKNVNFTTTTTTTTNNATTAVIVVAADVDADNDNDNDKDKQNDNGNGKENDNDNDSDNDNDKENDNDNDKENDNNNDNNKEVNIALEKVKEEVKEEEEDLVIAAEFITQTITTTNITKKVKVYNSWDRIRYVCGIKIKPNTTAFINPEKNCTSTTSTTNNVIGDDEHGSKRKTISSLFLSTRIFEYDPPVPVPQQPRRTSSTHAVNVTTTDDTQTQAQIQTQTQTQPRIPTITIRFGEEVDYPILINSYHTFGVDDKHSQSQSQSQCHIPCQYYNDFYPMSTKFVSFETLPHVIKEISMEGSGYYSKLTIDPNAHEQHHYYATTSFQSEIPLTYYSLSKNSNENNDNDLRSISKYPPVNFDDPSIIKGASFLAKNCGSINQREQIVKQLIDYTTTATNNATAIRNEKRPFRIDSLSTCLHNADFPFNSTLTSGTVNTVKSTPKQDIMKLYLFHLAFENQNEKDYITEKLWQTLKSGTIPIYWGASNIQDHLPSSHSAILIKDYLIIDNDDDDDNPQNDNNNDNKLQQRYRKKNKNSQVNITQLVNHLRKVANNRTLYYEYHSWRINTTNTGTNTDTNTDTNDLDNDGDNDKSSSTSDNNDNDNDNNNDDNNNKKNNDSYYQKFTNKYEFTKIHSYCRICYFGYANKYGWKFNYQKQIIQELNTLEIVLPEIETEIETETEQQQQAVLISSPQKLFSNSYNRSTCIDINKNRIVYPFQEIWTQTQTSSSSSSSSSSSTSSHITNTTTTTTPTTIDGDNGGDGDTDTDIDSDKNNSNYRCDISRNNHRHRTTIPYYIIDKDGKNNDKVFLERTIWDHDGVTDMEIVAVRRRSREKPISSTSTSTSTTTDDSGSSSVGLLLKFNITSFSKQNIKEMIVLKYHTKYNVESKWRNEKIQRYATASNKKSIKRIKMDATPTSSNSRNKDNRSKDKDNNATRTNTSSSSDNDNDDDEYDGYLKGGKLIWIQNGKSRIIFMVNKPNVLISSMNDNGGGDDNDINKNGSSTGKSYNNNSNKTSNSNNAGNSNTSNAFYYTVPLKDPGMIEIKIPTVTSQSAQTSQSLLRLRWIVEDIDTFHRNGKYKESYFSSVMVEEFFHPIEMMS